MRLLTFQLGEHDTRLGALVDGLVVDLAALASAAAQPSPPRDLTSLIQAGEQAQAELQALLAQYQGNWPAGVAYSADQVRLRAPLRPGKIVGVGLNYVEHVAESNRTLDTAKELPERPVLFCKPATAVVGPNEPIRHNSEMTSQLDWECELAVVIGRTASRVWREQALDYVFGYTIANDISARDQRRSGQWFFSKGQDSYAPMGPWVVTKDEVPDPQNLDVALWVNGEIKQKSNTRFMLFPIAQLIEDISSGMTLEPGDVISTGSPSGVGAAQVPPQFLQPGDIVDLEIETIGRLSNPVVAVS